MTSWTKTSPPTGSSVVRCDSTLLGTTRTLTGSSESLQHVVIVYGTLMHRKAAKVVLHGVLVATMTHSRNYSLGAFRIDLYESRGQHRMDIRRI